MNNKLMVDNQVNLSPGVSYFPLICDQGLSLGFNLSSVNIEPGCGSVLESHQVRELWMMVAGVGTVQCDGKDLAAKPGDVFYFDSFTSHKVTNTGDSPMVLTSMWWSPDAQL